MLWLIIDCLLYTQLKLAPTPTHLKWVRLTCDVTKGTLSLNNMYFLWEEGGLKIRGD